MKMVMQKANISEMASQVAIETVANYLSDKLPAPIAGQVKSALGMGEDGLLSGLTKGLGSKGDDAASGLGDALNKLF